MKERILKFESFVVAMFVIGLIPLSIGFWLIDRESEARVVEQELLRMEAVRGLKIVLVNQCRETEKVKRDIAITIRQLSRSPDDVIGRALRRFAPRPGGCGEYPPPIRP